MANKTVSLVEDLIADFLKENDLFLWDAEFVKEGRDWYLRLFIDRTDGEYVSTDDCEMVSEFLSKQLDERDPIEQNYYLEVSSPGMDRELVKPEHFKACIGQEVEVRTYVPMKAEAALTEEEGFLDLSGMKIKEFTGELLEYVEEPEERVKVRTVIDTKAQNRKPGARISPSALKECIIELPLKDIAKINLAVIFE
ncbi:MAG: ribosome maturation factor RimP [Firmicutes bacterium]|jgi:ribosome maturation factor RimP|nr:ribosome maturation factor RimP [Bacillota bacterium]